MLIHAIESEIYDIIAEHDRFRCGRLFNGRAEFGEAMVPVRSLLIRSLMQKVFSIQNKKKRGFRPFAPSILKNYVAEYFDEDDVPFMERFFQSEGKTGIHSGCHHVDGTAGCSLDRSQHRDAINLMRRSKKPDTHFANTSTVRTSQL